MRIPRPPHNWQITPVEAEAIQRRLAGRVRIEPPTGPLRLVAGIDAAFSKDDRWCIAGVVLWDTETRLAVERQVASKPAYFPYIPGLLAFREGPAVIAALRKLARPPDALLCDGQGVAHPRRLGIASHVGVLADLPAVGCGKSRLVGEHDEPAVDRGAWAELVDRGETVGAVLRTRNGVRPLYVSVGHRLDLAAAIRLVLDCGSGYRLPEPIRLADRLVREAGKRSRFTVGNGDASGRRRPGQ